MQDHIGHHANIGLTLHSQIIWAVKHSHIGDAFFDLDAAAFLCTQLPNTSTAARTSASATHVEADAQTHRQTSAASKGGTQPTPDLLKPQSAPKAAAHSDVTSKHRQAADRLSPAQIDAAEQPASEQHESNGALQPLTSSVNPSRQQQDSSMQQSQKRSLQAKRSPEKGSSRLEDASMQQLPQRSRHQRRPPASQQALANHSTEPAETTAAVGQQQAESQSVKAHQQQASHAASTDPGVTKPNIKAKQVCQSIEQHKQSAPKSLFCSAS